MSDNQLAKASFSCQLARSARTRPALLQGLPGPLKQMLKLSALSCLDAMDLLRGCRKELIPPRYLNFGGDGDFEKTGSEFLGYFVKFGELRPEHRVLEVGSGIGRMARPLTKYLVTGSYEGIDIVPRGVRWCQRHFHGRHPNFHFQLADVRNREYNPKGHIEPTEYRLPFNDDEFDFAYLTSVFTHMLRPDMEHYFREVIRTLRPHGKCLITFFLLNEESRKLLAAGLSSLDFRFPQNGCWAADEHLPENALAYDEEEIRNIYRECGSAVETVAYGAWSGRSEYLSYQDIVVARKISHRNSA